jgi:hypothetical protein
VPTSTDPAMLYPLLPPPRPEEVERRRSIRRRQIAVALLVLIGAGTAIGDRMTEGKLRPEWMRPREARPPAPRVAVRIAPGASAARADSTATPSTSARTADRARGDATSLSAMARQRLVIYTDTLEAALDGFDQAFIESGGFGKREQACTRMEAAYLTALRASAAVAIARRNIAGPLQPAMRQQLDMDAERVGAIPIRMSAVCGA